LNKSPQHRETAAASLSLFSKHNSQRRLLHGRVVLHSKKVLLVDNIHRRSPLDEPSFSSNDAVAQLHQQPFLKYIAIAGTSRVPYFQNCCHYHLFMLSNHFSSSTLDFPSCHDTKRQSVFASTDPILDHNLAFTSEALSRPY
jgi:hypothetical protein